MIIKDAVQIYFIMTGVIFNVVMLVVGVRQLIFLIGKTFQQGKDSTRRHDKQ